MSLAMSSHLEVGCEHGMLKEHETNVRWPTKHPSWLFTLLDIREEKSRRALPGALEHSKRMICDAIDF